MNSDDCWAPGRPSVLDPAVVGRRRVPPQLLAVVVVRQVEQVEQPLA